MFISFGSSLFAGIVNDGGATAYSYMRDETHDAYALDIELNSDNGQLFHIPQLTALESLFGHGEMFHARSKAFASQDGKWIGGFYQAADGAEKDESVRSSLSKEEFEKRYKAFCAQNTVKVG